MLSRSLIPLCIALFAPLSAWADPWRQDDHWLKTMEFAAHQTDYSGTFVYQSGNHSETSRITHLTDSDGEHERLESLDGTQREIVRTNDEVWYYDGDRKVKVAKNQAARSFPALLPEQISLLNENYLIKPGDEDRVAGFHAHVVVFQPKDNLRYSHKMWADSSSGLLLKAAVLDEHGQIVEQYAFTQLTLGGVVEKTWKIPAKPLATASRTMTSLPKSVIKNSGWKADALPAGFKKTLEVRRPLKGKESPATQMVFSDGLAGISIFIEELSDNPNPRTGLSSKGVIQFYSKVMGEHLITVVGEVPAKTVMQIADSVRYGGQ
jgi:sigma-E factor negative regulatory protein RseB